MGYFLDLFRQGKTWLGVSNERVQPSQVTEGDFTEVSVTVDLSGDVDMDDSVSISEAEGDSSEILHENTRVIRLGGAPSIPLSNIVAPESLKYRGFEILAEPNLIGVYVDDTPPRYLRCLYCGEGFIQMEAQTLGTNVDEARRMVVEAIQRHHNVCSYVEEYNESSLQSLISAWSETGSFVSQSENTEESLSPERASELLKDDFEPYVHIRLPGIIFQKQRPPRHARSTITIKKPKANLHNASCTYCGTELTSLITGTDDMISSEMLDNVAVQAASHSCLKEIYQTRGLRKIRI